MSAPRPARGSTPGRVDLPHERATDHDTERLRRYLKVNSVVLAITIVALAVTEVFLRSWHLAFALLCLMLVVGALLVAWRLAAGGRSGTAAQLLALATWASALAVTTASPFILPISVLWVLMPVVLPLVTLPRRVVRRLMGGTVAAAVCVASVGVAIPEAMRVEPPLGFEVGIVVGSVAAITVGFTYSLSLSFERSAEEQELLRDSRRRIVSAAYEVRRQIERDLHDGAQQRLVSTSVRLALASRLLQTDRARAEEALAEAAADLKLALQDLRELAHGIYPPQLVERGLGPALIAATRRAPFPVSVAAPAERLPMNVEASVYFCCLEAVQNAVKHAAPTGQWIDIGIDDGPDGQLVRFRIRDDGVGFDAAQVFHTVGLRNITDRVYAVGGTVTIESAPGEGTVVSGTVPLVESADPDQHRRR